MATLSSIPTAKMLLSLLCLCWLADAQPGKRLWVLQEPDRIAEFDLNTFVLRSSHQVPAEVFQSPQDLQINGKGQMLFVAATVREPDGLVHESSNPRMWFWDGSSARFLNRTITNTQVPSRGSVVVSTAKPRCFLSANGAHLFWFENRFKTTQTPDMGQDIAVNTTFHGWQTDLSEEHPEDIATYSFAPCKCETAVCSETCPEASYWLPDTGIDDHFIITNWVPGQLQSEYRASFLYRKSAGGWTKTRFPSSVEQVLDSAWDGSGLVLIETIADGGCCGWVNASDDQTLLTKNGKSVVLFDEFRRYQNQDYDVSFFTAKAKLSPHSILAALTITATSEPGSQLRLSDSGKANAAELSRIQQGLQELPAVEVLRLDEPPKRTAMIPHAMLVGWVNDEEILVVENSFLVSFNVISGRRRKSEIKVARESHAFLR
jgi:hypothetical protein